MTGLLVFIVVEKLFSLSDDEDTNETIDSNLSTNINSVNNNHKDLGKVTNFINGRLDKGTNHIQVNITYN